MDTIIDAFTAFFDSDLGKSELAIRIGIVVIAFLLGIILTVLVHRFIINFVIYNQNAKLKEENKELKESNKQLIKENKSLKERLEKYQEQIDMDELCCGDEESDTAVVSVIREK